MGTTLTTPAPRDLPDLLEVLASWMRPGTALQLHPGDLGWLQAQGADAAAAALRVWRRGTRPVAVGMLDGPDLLRVAVDPDLLDDESVAGAVVADLADPDTGVLPAGEAGVEAPMGSRLHAALGDAGWDPGEAWAMLLRDLTDPVEEPAVPIEQVAPENPDQVLEWATVHVSAFGRPASAVQQWIRRWPDLVAGPAFADARCLLARDASGTAVAQTIVWSAGPGRYGVVEPMGVHADHRGGGYGRAITLAGAAALRDLGCPAAFVCTPTGNVGGVRTYRAAGYDLVGERLDRQRAAA